MEPMEEMNARTPQEDAQAEGSVAQAIAVASAGRAKAECRMIAFSLAGRDYGIDIMKVKEISHEGKFTYVPNAAHYMLGVHNLRGEIIPVIDLRRMFNLPVPEVRAGSELSTLILKLEKLVLGVVVDSIDGVMSTPADSVQPPHPIFDDINMQYISGVVEKDGKLYVILDVERIFQETAPAPKPVARAERPAVAVERRVDQELRFVCEGLGTFTSFFVTPLNHAWVERRFGEWKKIRTKSGLSTQLEGIEDAREFLSTFASPQRVDMWSDALRKAFIELLPPHLAGSYVVWNYGCGRGFDSYSLTCALKAAFPTLGVKVWANDGNLVEIASAPTLTLPKERVPAFYIDGGFMRQTETGYQFSAAIRDGIIFEYTESLARAEGMQADLIVSRDVVSFKRSEAQKALLEVFSQKLKPGGLLVLGENEHVEGGDWRAVEKGGLHAFVREGPKE